jgi:flagellar hook-length control protein FliK
MESNLSFLANRAIASPVADASPATAPAHSHADRGDFAEVLNGQTLKAQRQHLAARDAPGQGLQVVPLGRKLNIITSDAPLPDMDSLAQFARMQGLDEGAVQALFGTPSVAAGTALGADTLASLATATPQGLASALDKATAATPSGTTLNVTPLLSAAAQMPLASVGTALAPTPALAEISGADADKEAASAPEPASASALAAPSTLDFLAVPPATVASLLAPVVAPTPLSKLTLPASLGVKEISVALGAAPAALGLGTSTEMNTTPATLALGTAAATQTSLMPMTAQAWIGSAPVAQVDASAPAAPMAPQDAVRLTLAMPAPEITKRLAQMSGTGKETTWAALLASGPVAKDLPGAIETVHLELPEGFDADLLASATDTPKPSDLSTQAGAAGALPASAAASTGSGNNADTAQAQADQRAQQFQQLADKMGQAAAQRLIAQIERGQWKMQMRMQPAALGSIHVQLDMHAGGLDALFSTDNAVTRELMAQGSNKLRDTLSQAGMTVASVTVNGEQSRQSGGNSTPGKGRNPSPEARPVSGLASAAIAAPQGGASAAADGLNVLA